MNEQQGNLEEMRVFLVAAGDAAHDAADRLDGGIENLGAIAAKLDLSAHFINRAAHRLQALLPAKEEVEQIEAEPLD